MAKRILILGGLAQASQRMPSSALLTTMTFVVW